jgi:hypothetical protein
MPPTLPSSRHVLAGLMRHDPDPRVRRRAHALLLVAEGRSLGHVARLFHTAPTGSGRGGGGFWRAGGPGCAMRPGLVGPPSSAPPPWVPWKKLSAAALKTMAS